MKWLLVVCALLFGAIAPAPTPSLARVFDSGITYSSAAFMGTSITLGVRSGVTAAQALPALVGASKHFVPVVNAGIGGDTSTGMLARFQADVLAYNPSMVSIEACYNDSGAGISTATCQSNVTTMIQMAQRTGARVTLWVPTFSCTPALDSSIAPYRTIIRNLAVTYSTDLFDTYSDFVALSGATQTSYFNPSDCQHFSPAGLSWMAGRVGSGAYANSFTSATASVTMRHDNDNYRWADRHQPMRVAM